MSGADVVRQVPLLDMLAPLDVLVVYVRTDCHYAQHLDPRSHYVANLRPLSCADTCGLRASQTVGLLERAST